MSAVIVVRDTNGGLSEVIAPFATYREAKEAAAVLEDSLSNRLRTGMKRYEFTPWDVTAPEKYA